MKVKLPRKVAAYAFTSLLVIAAGLLVKPGNIGAVCIALTSTFTAFVAGHQHAESLVQKSKDKEEAS